MSSGAYVALTGMQARSAQLDRLAADLANSATSGYKSESATTIASERQRDAFGLALQSAIDVADGPRVIDFSSGSLTPTGRDLDLAIDGEGFFVVNTPNGPRYTRNGHFTRLADGTVATEEGFALQGEAGPIKLPAGSGAVTVGDDGTLRSGGTSAGQPLVVTFAPGAALAREDGARFRADGVTATPVPSARVLGGTLEQSNVSVVERMVQLTDVSRGFEALQRGVTILMNDCDGRAITELGRR
jgi:flagellar basal body rod protein FlgG